MKLTDMPVFVQIHIYELGHNRPRTKPDKKIKCPHCPKRFHQNFKLKAHIIVHNADKPFSCTTCGNTFKTNSALLRHIRDLHEQTKKYCCEDCGKEFNSKTNYVIHRKRHKLEFVVHCEECREGFVTKTEYRRHMDSKHNEYVCDVCGKSISSARHLKEHRKIHETDYEERYFQEHLKKPIREDEVTDDGNTNESTKVTRSVCVYCYLLVENLTRHYFLTHGKYTTEDTIINLGISYLKCSNCSKLFPNEENVILHSLACQRTATEGLVSYFRSNNATLEQCHQCISCGLVFKTQQSAISHMKLVHEGENFANVCFECKKCFGGLNRMVTHYTFKHVKTYVCGECERVDRSLNMLREHIVSKHGPDHSMLLCQKCLYEGEITYFLRKSQLSIHRFEKHNDSSY